ncbi:MAG: hypothetical protein ABI304_02375 [Rudaea sp.]
MIFRICFVCAFTCALFNLTACSKATPNSPANASTLTKAGSVCERNLLAPDDVGDILGAPVVGTKPLRGDRQTCYFTAKNAYGTGELRVTLRPGLGEATIATFTSGKMDAYAKWSPLAGVGDSAVWKPDLHEVSAQKNNVLCEVAPTPMSMGDGFAHSGEANQKRRLGALCNKIFANLLKD